MWGELETDCTENWELDIYKHDKVMHWCKRYL